MSNPHTTALRVAIALMVLDHAQNGLWALLGAEDYFRSLPGTTRPASDEVLVLVRDLGAARLTLALLLVVAAVLLDRTVLLVALTVASFAGIVRLVAHLDGDSSAQGLNWVGYALGAAVPLALVVLVWLSSSETSAATDTPVR